MQVHHCSVIPPSDILENRIGKKKREEHNGEGSEDNDSQRYQEGNVRSGESREGEGEKVCEYCGCVV